MKSHASNVAFMILGAVFLFISARSLFHHQYEYFDSFRQVWISYVFWIPLGIWFFLYGLIGLVRVMRGAPK